MYKKIKITRKKLEKLGQQTDESINWLTERTKQLRIQTEDYREQIQYIKDNGSKKKLLLSWKE